MKNISTIILLFISFNAFSQIHKRQWLIGGNATYSFAKSKELRMRTAQLSPAGGYFFINKLAGGARIDLTSETYKWTDTKFRFANLSVGPFLRFYFLPEDQQVNFFADAGYSFAYGWHKDFTHSSRHKYNFRTFSLMAGPALFLNKNTSLEVTFRYSHSSRGPIDTTITNKLQVGLGLQVHFGKPKI